jgi:hypothetical protein
VLDGEDEHAQRGPDTGLLPRIAGWPIRVVGTDGDGSGHLGGPVTDARCAICSGVSGMAGAGSGGMRMPGGYPGTTHSSPK